MHLVYTAPIYHTNQHFPIKALLEAGHEVSFLVLRRYQNETHEAIVPTVLGYSPTFEMLRRLAAKCLGASLDDTGGMPPVPKFWREMRRSCPAAVIVRDPFHAYGLLAVLATKLIGTRLVLYIQTPKHRRLKGWKRAILALFQRVAGGEWMTPVLGVPNPQIPVRNPLRYVPFVMPPQTAPRDKQWFADGAINILTVGQYQRRKNHRLFLDAIRRLSRQYPIRATIVGECVTAEHRNELDNLKQHCEHLALNDVIAFEVNLPLHEVQQYYASHDVFVLATREDWAAISPLEAMAHALPVVCSHANGTSCYIRPGENGFVFRSDDPDDLEACLHKIVSDRKRLVEMGHQSYHRVVSHHAPERYVEALMAMIGRNEL